MDFKNFVLLILVYPALDIYGQSISEVEIKGAFEVHVTIGEFKITKTGTDEDRVKYEINERKIKIYDSRAIKRNLKTKVFLSMPTLVKLSLIGQCHLISENLVYGKLLTVDMLGACKANLQLNVDSLNVRMSGDNILETTGKVMYQRINLLGGGEYRGFKLKSKVTNAHALGAGQIEIFVVDSLRADATGEGMIIYRGDSVKVKAKHQSFLKHKN